MFQGSQTVGAFLHLPLCNATTIMSFICPHSPKQVVPRGENPSYPHHAYAPSNENNNLTGVNTIEALKEAYREMVIIRFSVKAAQDTLLMSQTCRINRGRFLTYFSTQNEFFFFFLIFQTAVSS